ncbi:TPA: hypothetical protein VAM28_003241 [Acinetobacter baumannii]|nr:hypothetical protein [Acinetobacter baumannii]
MSISTANLYFSNFHDISYIESFMNKVVPEHFEYQYKEELDESGHKQVYVEAIAKFSTILSDENFKAWVDKIFQEAKKQDIKFHKVMYNKP